MNISPEDQRLWVKIAKLYFEDDFTQGEIAKKLGFSRVKIHRILRSAKEAGIVQVHIKAGNSEGVDLEHKLIHKYNLRDCVIVDSFPSGEESYLALTRGASRWLKQHLRSGIRVGLGLGRTLSYLPEAFEVNKDIACTFTEITGAVSDHSWGFDSNNIASRMAEKCGGKAEVFYAPTLVSTVSLKEQLIKERSVKKALERARSCDIVLQSVGPLDETAILFIHGYLSRQELDRLKDMGGVGDALGCYFDKAGQILPSSIEELMIGLHLSELADLPWSVLVGGGIEKINPIDASIKGGYFNVLVTDQLTGEQLLKKE